jgi:SAM-dependent methyltransferase
MTRMSVPTRLAPGVPGDYYRRIFDAEETHFWYRGMRSITIRLLAGRFDRPVRVLDAGCGTGGMLRSLLDEHIAESVAGADIANAAIELARERVPEADLRVASLRELPFDSGVFELVVANDVLQHVHDEDVYASLTEMRRVLTSDGLLLLRTNGSRKLRREREDWRAYDAGTIRAEFERAGFAVRRLTHANTLLSLLGSALGRVPHAPTEKRDGIPMHEPGRIVSVAGRTALTVEAWWLGQGRSLPYGHTLFALAEPDR